MGQGAAKGLALLWGEGGALDTSDFCRGSCPDQDIDSSSISSSEMNVTRFMSHSGVSDINHFV